MDARIFRLIMPVGDIEAAATFYAALLDAPGERVWRNRHYFPCGDVILACVEAPEPEPRPARDPRIVYFAVDDLDAVFARARAAGPKRLDDEISEQAWGERSFYLEDPFGNPLCFVARDTVYKGLS